MKKFIEYIIQCCLSTLGIFAAVYSIIGFVAFTTPPFYFNTNAKVLCVASATILSIAFCVAIYLDNYKQRV